MANTVTRTTITDGPRWLIVKIHLNSDGTEETALELITAADYSPPFVESALMFLDYSMTGNFSAKLMWEGTPNRDIVALSPDTSVEKNWADIGGLINQALGRTGDILLETTGIANTDEITLVLHIAKRDRPAGF
jgi:hypothetical protein